MMFCPKCGAILKTKIDKGKTIMYCSCGYSSKELKDAEIKEKIDSNQKDIEVIEKELDTNPIVKAKCEKCGNNKAHFWMIQTRAGDEPETKFFKCTKCGHIWRDYS